MKNSPKSIFVGWTALALCAVGGYIGSKKYTDYRLKEYTSSGGFRSKAKEARLNQEQNTMNDNDGENKPLRRSVERTL